MSRFMIGMALAALLSAVFPALAAEPTAEERAAMEKVVRDYILTNPEIVEQALMALQAKREETQQAQAAGKIATLKDKIFESEHQAVVGNPEGKVTLVEFFDYNCGYCKRAVTDVLALIETNPDLRVVIKEFPILSEASMEAARVSIAVKNVAPERYLEFHQAMFEREGRADKAKGLAVAKEIGLDVSVIEAAAADDAVIEDMREAHQLAGELGISGTPSYVIAGEVVHGAAGYDALAEKVKAAAACGETTC